MSPSSTDSLALPRMASSSMDALVAISAALQKAPLSTELLQIERQIGPARWLGKHAGALVAAVMARELMPFTIAVSDVTAPLEACTHDTMETTTIVPRPNSPLVEAVIRTDEILHLAGELYADSRPASREERIAAYSALRRAGRPTRR
ncbi:MAG: hypothetical protein ACYC5Q_16575 [Thermoleophilia bacterium]